MSNVTDRVGGARASLAWKAPCRVATTTNIALTGFQVINGVTLAEGDDNLRVFVKDQNDAAENGIWIARATAWVRAKDFDGDDDVCKGTSITVAGGTTGSGWYRLTSADPITIGDTDLTFTAFNDETLLDAQETIADHIADVANPHAVTKTQVGLGNADNTSDANKPVSTATQTALDLKAPLASPTFTGTPAAPTPSITEDSTRLATTAYVKDLFADREPHIGDYGSIGGANASPAVQAMIDDLGYFHLPVGTFTCQDPIIIPHAATGEVGQLFSGRGREMSRLQASGMSGESLIKLSQSGYVRMTMRDVGLIGDADTALDLRVGGGFELFECSFYDLNCVSVDGPALLSGSMFSTRFDRVDASSTNDHSFQIVGGPGVTMTNCYAHACGATSAGYAITGGVTLIGCNGVDQTGNTHHWAQLGGSGTFYIVKLIGCNLEDFGQSALYLTGDGGWLSIDACSFVAQATGTFLSYIEADTVNSHSLDIRLGCGTTSKGASMTGASKIVTSAGFVDIFSFAGQVDGSGAVFPDYRDTGAALTYPVPFIRSAGGVYGKIDLKVSRLYSELESGFVSPQVFTITANASTYDATSKNCVKTANTVATNLDGLTGCVEGQHVTVIAGDANTTVRHNVGGAGRFIMAGAANVVAATGDVFHFVCANSVLKQI